MAIAHLGRRSSELMGTRLRKRLRFSYKLMLCAVVLRTGSAWAQDPPCTVLTVRDGLPSNTVYGMLQDRKGYLWFGTDAGLARYDGRSFRVWTTSDGLSDNEVLSVHEDPLGRIWCLTLNGRLSYVHDGKAYGIKEHPELALIRPASGTMGMAVDNEGFYWFGGIGGELFSWRGGVVKEHRVVDRSMPMVQSGMTLPLRTRDGHVRVFASGSLYGCRGGEPEYIRAWDIQSTGIPMVSAVGDSLVAHSAKGLVAVHDGKDAAIPVSEAAIPGSYRPPCVLEDGTVCHSTGGYGVVLRYPAARQLPTKLILEQMMVNSTIMDREHTLWCSTDGQGVVRINSSDRDLTLIQASVLQRDRSVTALLRTRSGHLVFGTAGGAIFKLRGNTFDTLLLPPVPLSARERVRDLQESVDGAIWFTTDGRTGRIVLGKNPRMETIASVDDRLSRDEVPRNWGQKSLATGTDGTVAASAFGLAILEHGRHGPLFAYRKRYRETRDRIYAPHVMPDGTIWFETNERLHRLQRGAGPSEQIPLPGSKDRITDIDALEDGTLVIATAGGGTLLVRDGKIIARFGTDGGAPSDQCRAAVVRNGRILVATDAGAYVITDPTGAPTIRAFQRSAGSPLRDVVDIDGDEQHLYLATPDGLCIVPLPLHEPFNMAPLLSVEQVLVNDSIKPHTGTVEVLLGDRVTVVLSPIAYTAPGQVITEWSTAEDGPWQPANREIQFSGLAAGTHRFHYRASLPSGPFSAIQSLTVLVIPPWYRTTWASVLLLLLCAVLLWLFSSAYFRAKVRRQKQAFMAQLATQEERHRIASELHDDLGADISHLLMLSRQTATSGLLSTRQKDLFARLEEHAGSLMHKIDEIIWSMDPEDDELFSSLAFIQRYCEEFAGSRGLTFRTHALPIGPPVPISSKARRDLYLVVKELLQNIIKHNDVSSLRVGMAVPENRVLITIEDDGVPKKEPKTNGRNGHGKANIMERLHRLNATLTTGPIEPGGTRTTITLPIPTERA